MSNLFVIIYALIPVASFAAGIFLGFSMVKNQEVPTPRKVYRKMKEEKRIEEKEDIERKEQDELEEYIKAIDEFGV